MKNFAKAVILAAELRKETTSISEAVSMALNNLEMGEEHHIPIYLLLYSHWVDIVDWAKVVDEESKMVDLLQILDKGARGVLQ